MIWHALAWMWQHPGDVLLALALIGSVATILGSVVFSLWVGHESAKQPRRPLTLVEAIERSICLDEIVHLPYDADLYDDLHDMCDGCVALRITCIKGTPGTTETAFWGGDAKIHRDWHIHMTNKEPNL